MGVAEQKANEYPRHILRSVVDGQLDLNRSNLWRRELYIARPSTEKRPKLIIRSEQVLS